MAAEVTFDLGKSLEDNLKANGLPTNVVAGGMRKYRKTRGGDGEDKKEEATTYAAVWAFLKNAVKQAGKAAGYGFTGAAIIAAANDIYGSATCDRLMVNMARATPLIPGASSYVASCDAANSAYAAAIAASMLAAVPLALQGAKQAALIVISQETLDSITDGVKGILSQASAAAQSQADFDKRVKEAASKLLEEEKAKAAEAAAAPAAAAPAAAAPARVAAIRTSPIIPPPAAPGAPGASSRRRGSIAPSVGSRTGGSKTKKGKSKRRVTRRRKSSRYLAAPVFAY